MRVEKLVGVAIWVYAIVKGRRAEMGNLPGGAAETSGSVAAAAYAAHQVRGEVVVLRTRTLGQKKEVEMVLLHTRPRTL